MSYITKAELRGKPFLISEQELDNEELDLLLGITKAVIDKATNQSFDKEEGVSKELDGDESISLTLPKYLITLTEIKIFYTKNDSEIFDPSYFSVKPLFIRWKNLESEESNARFEEGEFPKGIANVIVKGDWGWAKPPMDIKWVQGNAIKRMLKEGTIGRDKDSENIGDYSYSLMAIENAMINDPEFNSIIEKYQFVSPEKML